MLRWEARLYKGSATEARADNDGINHGALNGVARMRPPIQVNVPPQTSATKRVLYQRFWGVRACHKAGIQL